MQHNGLQEGLLICLKDFVEKHNKETAPKLIEKNSALKLPMNGSATDSLVDTEKSFPVNSYFWVEALKYVVQNGRILKLKEPRVKAAFRLFLQQLRQIQEISPQNATIYTRPEMKDIFLEFIGQLCAIGQLASAQVIHQFLHFGIKTTLQHKNSASFIENFSVALGGPICDALELTGKIAVREMNLNKKEPEEETLRKTFQDYKFLSKLMAAWIQAPIFQLPFDPFLYRQIKQNAATFDKELEIVIHMEEALLTASHVQLEQGLANLRLTPLAIPAVEHNDKKVEKSNHSNGLLKTLLFGPEVKKAKEPEIKATDFQYLSYHKPLPPLPKAEAKQSPLTESGSDKKGKKHGKS